MAVVALTVLPAVVLERVAVVAAAAVMEVLRERQRPAVVVVAAAAAAVIEEGVPCEWTAILLHWRVAVLDQPALPHVIEQLQRLELPEKAVPRKPRAVDCGVLRELTVLRAMVLPHCDVRQSMAPPEQPKELLPAQKRPAQKQTSY